MATSALWDTKMRTFLLGLVLGLLAVVHSTPVDTVTQIAPKAEDDVFREAVTDGFLIDRSNLPSVPAASPTANASVQSFHHPGRTTQAPPFGLDTAEGSAAGEVNDGFTMTTTGQSSTSASHQTTASAPTTFNILSTLSDSGSGDGDFTDQFSTTTSSTTSETSPAYTTSETSPASMTSMAPRMFAGVSEPTPESYSGSGSGSGVGPEVDVIAQQTARINFVQAPKAEVTESPMPAGHSTPDWIIILGFIVGVAALVLLCVAIATRDKWNAPKHAAQPAQQANNNNASNQQRAEEMETFLNKEMPKENGKDAEYTVIPLEELPEDYSSH